MKEIPNLKTTLHGLLALENLRGEPGSFQDSLHHDAIAAHAMRDTLDWAIQERDDAKARVVGLEGRELAYQNVLHMAQRVLSAIEKADLKDDNLLSAADFTELDSAIAALIN